MKQLGDKYKSFKAWQVKPYEVAKLSANKHKCATCHTEFHGNYCPRCGQSASIGRYSLKTTFLLFLDVWGLGNRGMFRTIRDLLLRPGYMIRDYLSGMQMAYFPPFKMFFLLLALNVLVDSGFNVRMTNTIKKSKELAEKELNISNDNQDNTLITISKDKKVTIEKTSETESKTKHTNKLNTKGNNIQSMYINIIMKILNWIIDNGTIVWFLWLLIISGPMFLFFRHNPNIPDIHYSEFFVALVYITNMMTIISIVNSFFFPLSDKLFLAASLLSVLALKQLCGYSFMRTFFKVIASFILLGFVSLTLIVSVDAIADWILDL